MRYRWLVLVGVSAGLMWAACGDDGAPFEPEPTDTIPINWAGSAVVYDTLMEKQDHSFVYFMAHWCGYCRKLETETLTDSTVAAIIGESFNAVKIDVDADSSVAYFDTSVTCGSLTALYGVQGIPTVVFFDRAGAEVARQLGYLPPGDFAAVLRHVRDDL